MQARWIVLTLVCVALIAAGQVLFKVAASHWRIDGWTLAAARSFLSPTMIVALFVYGAATLLWVYVLRSAPLNLAYPLFSLAFLLTPVVAHFAIGEPLSWRTFAGGALIVAGVLVSTSS